MTRPTPQDRGAGTTTDAAGGPAVGPGPAADRIAAELRGMILAGELGAGARLAGEQALAARFGVSRPTLREALKRLAAQNLIRTRRGASGGTFVNRMGWDEARDEIAATTTLLLSTTPLDPDRVAEARLALLSACAPLAALRRTPAHLAAMRAEIAVQRAEATGDEAFCASDVRFHRTLAEASGNPLLALQLAGVIEAIQPLLNMLTYRSRDRAEIAARLARIVAMLERRDAAGMVRELEAASAYTAALVREAQGIRAARIAARNPGPGR